VCCPMTGVMGDRHYRGHLRLLKRVPRLTASISSTGDEAMRTSSFAAAALACLAALTACQVPVAKAAEAPAATPMSMGSDTRAAQPTGAGEAMFRSLQKLVGRWQAMLPNNKPIVDT